MDNRFDVAGIDCWSVMILGFVVFGSSGWRRLGPFLYAILRLGIALVRPTFQRCDHAQIVFHRAGLRPDVRRM